jgi:hypothetical protein
MNHASARPRVLIPCSILVTSLLLAACTDVATDAPTSADELRGLSKTEALAELGQVGDAVRAFYGPLEYKAKRFGFDLDAALADARSEVEAGETEADFVRPVYRLIAKLHDGHVSYQFPIRGDASSEFQLPLIVEPFEGAYAVSGMSADVASLGVAKGDTLVEIDGMGTMDLEKRLLPLVGNGAPESEKHFVGLSMTIRPFYVPRELQPTGTNATVVLKHADGSQYTIEIPWGVKKGGFGGQVVAPPPPHGALPTPMAFSGRLAHLLDREAGLLRQGSLTPFFLTPEVREALGVVEVFPRADTLSSFGVTLPETEASAPEEARVIQLHAYAYTFEGKSVLLVRIPTYSLSNGKFAENVAWLASLLKESTADVLVLDDSHNPGGSIGFGTGIASLFTDKPIPNVVQASHADRKWMEGFAQMLSLVPQELPAELVDPVGKTIAERLSKMEAAHDAHQILAPFAPFGMTERGPTVAPTAEQLVGENMLAPHPLVQWRKPVLVLIDELAGSCADIVPMLLKDGGVAKTFGTRTMGLGGNVEEVLTLPFSRAKLSLTRGLFGSFKEDPAAIRLIENNGVTPDYPYAHTTADLRAGFVGYATAFSKVAATLTRE